MAGITTMCGGQRCIQFVDENGARKTIRLGDCDRKTAESICRHVGSLLSGKQTCEPIKPAAAAWLKGLETKYGERRAAVGLIDASQRAQLGEFLKQCILRCGWATTPR